MLLAKILIFGVFFNLNSASQDTWKSHGVLDAGAVREDSDVSGHRLALASNNFVRTSNGSLGLYTFLRSECELGVFQNNLTKTILPSLMPKITFGSCLNGNGKIMSFQLQSVSYLVKIIYRGGQYLLNTDLKP